MLAAAVGLAFVAWLVVHHVTAGSSSSPSSTAATSTPAAVSAAQLAAISAAAGKPIYWAGPAVGKTYELKETSDGSTYVRYLPARVATGDPAPFLEVATYPLARAFAVTTAASQRPGTVELDAGPGTVAFYDSDRPTSVYEAFRSSNVQIEVFSPSPQQARKLVTGRKIVPVAGD